MLLDFNLTGEWIINDRNNKTSNATCSRQTDGKIQCATTYPDGEVKVYSYTVYGLEVEADGSPEARGTYDGHGTIRWLFFGSYFVENWRRTGKT